MLKPFPKSQTQKTGYLVSLPPDLSVKEKWPVIFFFHGIGQRSDGTMVGVMGIQTFIQDNWPIGHWPDQLNKKNVIAIFPNLLASEGNWSLGYVDDAIKFSEQFPIDKSQMHLQGHSLGGQILWGYAGSSAERGKMFASIIAIAPVYVQTNYSNIKSPVRIYVSQNDSLYQEVKSAWNALNATNPPVKAELIPTGSDHNICGLVFDNEETWAWMLSKSTTGEIVPDPIPVPEPVIISSTLKADTSATLTNVLGSSAILDGSKSTGYKRGSWEFISGPPNVKDVWNVFPGFNKEGIKKQINNLHPGKYRFALNVFDENNKTSSANVELTVQAAKKKVGEGMVNGQIVDLYEDNTWD